MQHITGTKTALVKMKVWADLQVSRASIELAFKELEDKDRIAACGVHEDCWVIGEGK